MWLPSQAGSYHGFHLATCPEEKGEGKENVRGPEPEENE